MGAQFVGLGIVEPRPCSGRLTVAGVPRHPRPAGVQLELSPLYSADYRAGDVGEPLDLRPLLDAVAARYDGCGICEEAAIEEIATSVELTTHTVGAALLTLGLAAPAALVAYSLDSAGARIALSIRNRGLDDGVDVSRSLPIPTRRAAVRIAVGRLVPLGWADDPVSNHCPPVSAAPTGLGDEAMLTELHAAAVP